MYEWRDTEEAIKETHPDGESTMMSGEGKAVGESCRMCLSLS